MIQAPDSRFMRQYVVATDSLGIDPLRDRMAEQIQRITSFQWHDVTQAQRGAPDLISYEYYGTEEFWWHIMMYNGINRWRSIVEGMQLKIPHQGALISITNDINQLKREIKTIRI